jgi:DNA-binding PadR family transcriptional regulator
MSLRTKVVGGIALGVLPEPKTAVVLWLARKGEWFVTTEPNTQRTWAYRMGLAPRTLERTLAWLKKEGVIEVERHGPRKTTYRLTDQFVTACERREVKDGELRTVIQDEGLPTEPDRDVFLRMIWSQGKHYGGHGSTFDRVMREERAEEMSSHNIVPFPPAPAGYDWEVGPGGSRSLRPLGSAGGRTARSGFSR